MHHHGLSSPILAERAPETAHRGCTILKGVEKFAKAPRCFAQSSHYPSTLARQSFGDFLKLMCSNFNRDPDLHAEENQSMWAPILNLIDEQQDRRN